MDTRDREAIDGLFTRIEDVERQAGPRDAEAERLIAERVQRQPAAPYYLAQTVVMQDLALTTMQARIDELEKAAKAQPAASSGGGFVSRAPGAGAGAGFGTAARTSVPGVGAREPWGQAEPQPGAYSQPAAPQGYAPQPVAYPQQGYAPPTPGFGGRMGGGGFLAGAAQTAVGVAGGVMLGSALGSMLGGHGGLFGGETAAAAGTTEVTETVTNNIYEAPQEDVRDVSDTGAADDAGYQDASFNDAGTDDGFAADDGGYDDV
ncbi:MULTISPECIES: DUF2076 domain-containing protein [unclassified Aureimonas]|uniref:DUF2076 domain-containing protein n=1 Tax=unclassified Aureimonas TaxID=2615206 RepID=UPI000701D678|nr:MULTISPECIES: DUF2076 domain-containing protein [unclassified Aureimonas]KQT52781.1 hypothetical protein ASG62_12680 [Aureimonas sp. Leaf427]KQT80240.1 hypothetical protein ASG54_06530 [Aureimonas sp. Leaf460]